MEIQVHRNDIFDWVIGNTVYTPIERCIDPHRYEAYDNFIHDRDRQEDVKQNADYQKFYEETLKLKKLAKSMQVSEIVRMCEELEQIAPKNLNL